MTKHLSCEYASLKEAAFLIKQGKLVAFPTETVYGLGASIFDEGGIQEIFRVKGRPQDNPLIAHIGEFSQLEQIAKDLSDDFYRLKDRFFPGPLTLVVPKKAEVPSVVSGGGETVAIRMPHHPIALAFIRLCGGPLVAPSANLSGKPSSTTAAHVLHDFSGKIAAVIDGGACEIGLESTVVSLCGKEPLLLRPGAVTRESLEEVLGKKIASPFLKKGEAPLSPGMKYRHYAPNAKVFLFESQEALERHQQIAPDKRRMVLNPTAELLYASLREADTQEYEEVCVLCGPEVSCQEALMNRLLKAAEKN